MPLEPGDRLGPYSIQALLGVGGMGEVYRGRDTRLGREVALKVISPRRVGDASNRRRFEIEARAASALNHPGIVTIYDVGESDGVSWIAMEWVEGRTLRQALAEGPLAVRDAWSIARQIADGLAAAHAKGIVHRDLKPENVMLAAEGRTKILDFGLARQTFVDALGSASQADQADTMAAPVQAGTFEGAILGTVGYMSPEQAAGRPVDFRSDQFALGLLAYEMLAGRRAFARPTAVETLSAAIRDQPVPLTEVRGGIPAPLLSVITRCLAKRPEDRFASTRDLAAALESVGTALPADAGATTDTFITPSPAAARARPARRLAMVLGAALVFALAAIAWIQFTTATPDAIDSLAVLPFENASGDPDAEYLSDGLTESLITQMSALSSLKVMARTTVFRYKGTKDPMEAGRKLGVGAVLTGTVARRGDALTISAELVEIATGVRLWGDTYNSPFADLLRVQDTIASQIAGGLHLRLSGEEKGALAGQGTQNAEAYELMAKARFLMRDDSEEGDNEAKKLLLLALEKDPTLVEAHLLIGTTYVRSATNGYVPPKEAWAVANEHLQKALAIDPNNVRARSSQVARRFLADWDWAGTEQEFQRLSTEPWIIRELSFHAMAMSFWARGRPQDAVALLERALRVDPGNPEARIMMADFLAHAGRLDEAIQHYRGIAESEPALSAPWFGLAAVFERRDDLSAAIAALGKAYELAGEEAGAKDLATARTEKDYENAKAAVARRELADLEEYAKERYISPLDFARLHARLGERDKAFAALAAALAERSPGLLYIKVEQAWDPIRDDPRFAAVVRQVGIP